MRRHKHVRDEVDHSNLEELCSEIPILEVQHVCSSLQTFVYVASKVIATAMTTARVLEHQLHYTAPTGSPP